MKRTIIILSCLLAGIAAQAQGPAENKHELSAGIGGGLSTLTYSPERGSQSMGFGGTFNLGYTFNISDCFGFVTGMELGLYNSKYEISTVREMYDIPSPVAGQPNSTFTVHGGYRNYNEDQRALFLNIPIMAQYSLSVGTNKFYVAGGVKLGIPVSATYKSNYSALTTWGYSAFTDQEYRSEHGFGVQDSQSNDGDLDLKVSIGLSLEAGLRWPLTDRSGLYTGVYFDYGLTNINNSTDKHMVDYNNGHYSYNSALNSSSSNLGIDKVNLMALGLKVRLSFGL